MCHTLHDATPSGQFGRFSAAGQVVVSGELLQGKPRNLRGAAFPDLPRRSAALRLSTLQVHVSARGGGASVPPPSQACTAYTLPPKCRVVARYTPACRCIQVRHFGSKTLTIEPRAFLRPGGGALLSGTRAGSTSQPAHGLRAVRLSPVRVLPLPCPGPELPTLSSRAGAFLFPGGE